ncbi:hypothetical protein [Salinicoccus roseus]|jgi:signal transduction histidine kinase|uniref:Uncharacterized protein n=1 Tax=Salinicoccus roseus TaxID=45670 RepID=A0A265E4W4_9STAP|nr:hypothetical protein [Salinicoccus roseus]OZT76627.1 hypothetical protein CFN03_10820 [Salinicoccus roseus]
MFGIPDLISLVISAFIILPVVVILRETGYVVAGFIFGATNSRLTLGSGPRLFKIGILDVRRHYHLYSWFSYDELKNQSRFAYIMVYASPILVNAILGLTINALLANGYMEDQVTFWNRFIFYIFYFVLFDAVPMKTVNGMPNNGLLIYEMLRYGKRTDHNKEPFLPSTSEVEQEYQEEMQELEEEVEEEKQERKEAEEEKKQAKEKANEEEEERKEEEDKKQKAKEKAKEEREERKEAEKES